MARTAQQIYDELVAKAVAEYAAVGATLQPANWSKYSPRRLTYWVFAVALNSLEVLWEEAKAFMLLLLSQRKTHTLGWYATMAKNFQYGKELVADKDYYDNTGLTQSQIDDMKIVKFASATDAPCGIALKVATLDGSGNMIPLSTPQLNALKAYMNRVKDAGVYLDNYYKNQAADNLKLSYKIYYDPLVLAADGKRIDGTNDTPVQSAIDAFIKSIDFDKKYRLDKQTDAIQAVDGVIIPHLVSAQAKYAALPYSDINVEYKPDSGYLRLYSPSDLTLEFIPYEVV
ncbi:hypothetical protein CAP35_13700 [Chitinophagaceae bacterium IBVUCB1]|nr:hypothetical protein CAP35_13700 [Chitinophagaceae bacterium IBVUCB1]